MGVISIALKHMFAAGMEPDAILLAIEEMEAAALPIVHEQAGCASPVERKRAADRERMRKKRENERVSRDNSDNSDNRATSCDVAVTSPLSLEQKSPTPPKTQTLSPSQKETPKGVSKKGSRIPENWRVGAEQRSAAIEAGLPAGSIALEGEKFRDYWLAKTGKDATKADWLATWRNWCRRAAENAKRFPPKPPDRPRDRGGFAAILQENLDELFGAGNHELSRNQPDHDWPAEPEIITPNRPVPRGFDAGGPGLFSDGYRTDELSNIVDFEPCYTYA